MNKLTTGQKVYVQPVGNAARYDKEVFEAEITSVGRKYFKLHSEKRFLGRTNFSIGDMIDHSEYTAGYKVFLSLEEIEDLTRKPESIKNINTLLNRLSYSELIKVEEFIKTL